jgi:hypothetical protein
VLKVLFENVSVSPNNCYIIGHGGDPRWDANEDKRICHWTRQRSFYLEGMVTVPEILQQAKLTGRAMKIEFILFREDANTWHVLDNLRKMGKATVPRVKPFWQTSLVRIEGRIRCFSRMHS